MKEKTMTKRNVFRAVALLAAVLAIVGTPLPFLLAATTTSNVVVLSNVRAEGLGAPEQGSLRWELGTDAGQKSITFTNGSGALAVNKVFVDHAATTTTYDLDGSLTDPTGSTISFSRIAMVRIVPATANAAALALGGDFILTKYLTGWVDDALTVPIHKTGFWQFVAPDATGVAVTASTGDQLTVTVSGSDEYDILILGS
jgi:hypothetical protein